MRSKKSTSCWRSDGVRATASRPVNTRRDGVCSAPPHKLRRFAAKPDNFTNVDKRKF